MKTPKIKFGAPGRDAAKKKKVVDEAPAKKKKKKVVEEVPVKKAKATKKPTAVLEEAEYIVLGKTTAILIVETDKGEVQIQKFYCTKDDLEWKRAKGGFNLPKDAAVLKKIRSRLKSFLE